MSILAWIIVGGIAGWIASMIMRTDEDQGIFLNVIVGIIGAFIGGFLIRLLGGDSASGSILYNTLVATVGAVILLAVVKAVRV
jgi:uncharacterized membrane protein YeaQ/YmgE (transglycosylase-associated protein family)